MKNFGVSLPTGTRKTTLADGTSRTATTGEPADDVTRLIAALTAVVTGVPDRFSDLAGTVTRAQLAQDVLDFVAAQVAATLPPAVDFSALTGTVTRAQLAQDVLDYIATAAEAAAQQAVAGALATPARKPVVTGSSPGDGEILATFPEVPGVLFYDMRLVPNGQSPDFYNVGTSGSSSPLHAYSLSGGLYDVRVAAVFDQDRTDVEVSDPVTIGVAGLAKPAITSVTPAPGQVSVAFDPVPGAVGYEAQTSSVGGSGGGFGLNPIISQPGTGSPLVITGLSAGDYAISLVAYFDADHNSASYNDISVTVTVPAASGSKLPTPVIDQVVNHYGQIAAVLQDYVPNANAYLIRIYNDAGYDNTSRVDSPTNLYIDGPSDLTGFTGGPYHVTVQAVGDGYTDSDIAGPVDIAMPVKLATPTGLAATGGAGFIDAAFDLVENADGYHVNASSVDANFATGAAGPGSPVHVLGAYDLNGGAQGPLPAGTYEVTVQATCSDYEHYSDSDYSSSVTVTVT